MSVLFFPPTLQGQTDANAVPAPKNLFFSGTGFVVHTGEDYVAPPVPTQDELDALAAREYAKLKALVGMTPAQISTWVDANVTTLATIQDALKTLAIAVSVLGRRI